MLFAAIPAMSNAAALCGLLLVSALIVLVCVLALLAVLHPDEVRRGEARRVLRLVLTAVRRR